MNQRERTLAIATAAVLGVAGAWSLVVDPLITRWNDLGAKETSLEGEVARGEALKNAAGKLKRSRDDLEKRLQTGGQAPTVAFVEQVRDLTRQAGFEPTNLKPGQPRPYGVEEKPRARGEKPPEPPFQEISFQLQARTTLARLQSFLVDLTASDRAVRVASLTLAPRPGSQDMDVDLTIVALTGAR